METYYNKKQRKSLDTLNLFLKVVLIFLIISIGYYSFNIGYFYIYIILVATALVFKIISFRNKQNKIIKREFKNTLEDYRHGKNN